MSGRAATTDVIEGKYALAVGIPDKQLAPGWHWKRLTDVADMATGHTPSRSHPEYWDGDIAWIGIKDAREFHGRRIPSTFQTVTQAGIDNSASVLLPKHTVCLSRTASVGYVTIMDRPMATSQDFVNWKCSAALVPEFLMYLLIAERDSLFKFGKGTTHTTIYFPEAKALCAGLPPPAEQLRIVAKIEELFSDLDAGVAALLRVRANLKRYRAAVLKAAVEGRLTQEWRTRNPATEPAAKLLERILVGRRAKWEQDQLRKFKEAGKTPPKGWKEKYVNPHTPEVEALHELPRSWAWATLDMIADNCGGITKGQKHSASKQLREVPYLRVANVQRGYLDLSEIKTIPATERDLEDLRLMPGDILFNEGGDRDKLGRGWVWNGEIPNCIHQNHVFRARLFLKDVQPKFVSYHGNSFGQLWFLRTGKQSVNLASINLTVLRKFPVPLPPAAEQVEIVAEVDRRLSVADAAEMQVAHALQRAARLRQSILKRAFEGRLVDQDPSDEPAAVLLRRIEAGGESSGKRGVQSRAAYPLLSRRRKGSLPTP